MSTATTDAIGEEDGPTSTSLMGEEATTNRIGEEGPPPTTKALGEEFTTDALGEEGPFSLPETEEIPTDSSFAPVDNPFGLY